MPSASPGVRRPRVVFAASGLGHTWRGYESITLESADALREVIDTRVYGTRSFKYGALRVRGIPTLERGFLEARLGTSPVQAYRLEQLTFSLGLALRVRQADIVHICDRGVARTLTRLRNGLGLSFRLVFCNSGNYGPEYVGRFDHGQLVTPFQWQSMVEAGLPPARLSTIPHGLHCARFRDVPESPPAARRAFGLPEDARLILTVTPWDFTKRLDHLTRELAALRDPSLFLVVAGQPTSREQEARRLAEALLPNRHAFISPKRARMPLLYRAADLVALCRLNEGLPMAYLEAMAAERPLVVHDWALSRWMVAADASRLDMTAEGALGARLKEILSNPDLARATTTLNAAHVREHFDWSVLCPRYLQMYERVLQRSASQHPASLNGSVPR